MAKRRKVIPVTLTGEQRERLERLWFYFGNYGPETTPGNHSFIQRLLEDGYDERPLYTKRTPKSEIPTPECESAVEAVLAINRGIGSSRESDGTKRGLRVISSAEARNRPNTDPEMKAVLDEMNRRNRVRHARPEGEDDTPDAA
jgi:hypothetical protein